MKARAAIGLGLLAALAEPPTPALASLSRAGTLLTGVADAAGRVDLGLGLSLGGRAPGESITAYLPAASVALGANGSDGPSGVWLGPDPQGGSWVRADGRLLRCSERRAEIGRAHV